MADIIVGGVSIRKLQDGRNFLEAASVYPVKGHRNLWVQGRE